MRAPVDKEISGLKFTSQPLPFPAAQELLPDAADFLSRLGAVLSAAAGAGVKDTDDVAKLLPLLDPFTLRTLMEVLNSRAPKLLASTTVVMTDVRGEPTRYELGKEKDRNAVFEEYPEAFIPVCLFAGGVTFKRFFPASARSVADKPAPSS